MSFQFGLRSTEKLNTCHTDLIKIHTTAIKLTRVDYGISEGSRSIERARDLFAQGKSKLDPDQGQLSKHITTSENPLSLATDIYIYHPDPRIRQRLIYDLDSLCFVAGCIVTVAEGLLIDGEISHRVRWGGNWDLNGEILTDQNFDDLCHFELIGV